MGFFPATEAGNQNKALQISRLRDYVGWICLALFWGLAIWMVNPAGEFCINDDWAYVGCLQALINHGSIISTWGKALITHLLWGAGFCKLFGYSLTTLRVSVIVAGVLCSFVFLWFLRFTGVSGKAALIGTLTLVASPLFFSQCFTYMTDITFACFVAVAFAVLCLGAEHSNIWMVIAGIVLSVWAMLDRQLGFVLPLGFVLACCLHPSGYALGRRRILLMFFALTVVPWAAYECYLRAIGSTPVTQSENFQSIFAIPPEIGLTGYLWRIFTRFLLCVLSYIAPLLSPILVLKIKPLTRSKLFRWAFLVLTLSFLLLEAAILAGFADLPVQFQRNVIINFGIGPLLLKDTYLLKIQRLTPIPAPLFYLLVFWAAISSLALVWFAVSFTRRTVASARHLRASPGVNVVQPFPALLAFISALAYIAVILPAGFHDRYLITPCLLLGIWLMLEDSDMGKEKGLHWPVLISVFLIVLLGSFSLVCTRDFMETKRAIKSADDFLVTGMNVDPCNMDGGLEFNGYYCFGRNPGTDGPAWQRQALLMDGRSWWCVAREDYLVSLGPIEGYRTIKTFPFIRWLGRDGAVHVLQPLPNIKTGKSSAPDSTMTGKGG